MENFKSLSEISEKGLKIPFKKIDNIEHKNNFYVFKEAENNFFYLKGCLKTLKDNERHINKDINEISQKDFYEKIKGIVKQKESRKNTLKKMKEDLKKAEEDINLDIERINKDINILKNQINL